MFRQITEVPIAREQISTERSHINRRQTEAVKKMKSTQFGFNNKLNSLTEESQGFVLKRPSNMYVTPKGVNKMNSLII